MLKEYKNAFFLFLLCFFVAKLPRFVPFVSS